MDPTATFNTFGKSAKDKCNVCQTKVLPKCNYLNYVDSQYIDFLIKHNITKIAVKSFSHSQ